MSYLEKVMKPIVVLGEIAQNRAYDTTEAARVVSCGPGVIRDLCKAGDLEHTIDGTRYRIRGTALFDLAKRDAEIRAARKAKAASIKKEQQRAWRQKHCEKQAVAVKQQQIGQIDMLDESPKNFRVNVAPTVYMQLRNTSRKLNVPISELASMMLAAGLAARG